MSLVHRVVYTKSELEKLKAELATKCNQVDELKKQLKNKQNLISRMKLHPIKIRKEIYRLVFVPELTHDDEETKHDNFFTNAIDSVSKLCDPY